jgi:FkbM family methyltransferase
MLAELLRSALRRRRARRFNRVPYVPLGRYGVVVTRSGHRIFVLAEDLLITPGLVLAGHWEPHVGALLASLLRPGDRVVEGGANVGCHTIPMAERIGPAGRIDAFEPVPDFLPLLRRSLAANRIAAEVVLHQAALLDRAGEVEIVQDPLESGSGHLALPQAQARYSRRIAARATTLDAELAGDGGRPVDLIRLDLEGAETLALRGAAAVLRRSPRLAIVMEWSPVMLGSRCDPAAEAAWLAALGFRFWRIRTGWRGYRLEPVEASALPQLPHGELLARRQPP